MVQFNSREDKPNRLGIKSLSDEEVNELQKLVDNDAACQKTTILQEAEKLITGERQKEYGHALDNFDTIGQIWSNIIQAKYGIYISFSPETVSLMLIGMKLARASMPGPIKRDTIVDIAGYAGCIEQIEIERDRRDPNSPINTSVES